MKVTKEEHAKIVEMYLEGKNFYDIAKAVFRFENEETIKIVADEVEKAEEAGEFVGKTEEVKK